MNLSRDSIEKVKKLAKRFTRNMPILCKSHLPDGLPIDCIDEKTSELTDRHPQKKFNTIVEEELKHQIKDSNLVKPVLRYTIKSKLKSTFEKEYYRNSDSRACMECYKNRINDDTSVPIRIELPEKYRNMDIR